MIARLSGTVLSVDFSEVVLDINGVGYGVSLPVQDVAVLQVGENASFHIVEVVREQAFDLYGFLEASAKSTFITLLKINGVGPRTALALIGLGSVDQMATAVAGTDVHYFSRAPGVGPKLASRLCLELKGKLAMSASSNSETGKQSQAVDLDVQAALEALGFKKVDIDRMVQSIDPTSSIEEQIKAALKER